MAAAASSVSFRAAVAPRAVSSSRARVAAARRVATTTRAAAPTVSVPDVKDHLDRGFVLVDIRDPDECRESGYKSSWKNIVLAAMDEDGTIHMNPNFLAQIRQEFPNTMSRMIIACDDGTFRSNKAADAIMSKLGHTNVKVLEGGIDAYLKAFPIDKSANKWNARPEIGQDLSTLVSGVDTRQAGQIYY